MITTIFSKSKPVNFIIVALTIIIVFSVHVFTAFNAENFSVLKPLLALFIVLFYMFVTDFIITKNELTKSHSYGIMTFAIIVAISPQIFNDLNLLISNLLVLFGLRRLCSLHTKRHLIKKFFDAVFWIGLASLFYAWSFLYLIVVVLALGYYWQNEGKYFAVTIFALLAVFVSLLIYNIIFKDAYVLSSNFDLNFSLDFTNYNNAPAILSLAIVASYYLWSVVYYIKNISDGNKRLKPIHQLVFLASIVAVVIMLLAPKKTGEEYVFLIVPFSIIMANYLETVEERWFKEMFVGLFLALPIFKLVLYFFTKS